jgi:hypothetical protein
MEASKDATDSARYGTKDEKEIEYFGCKLHSISPFHKWFRVPWK